LEAGASGVSAKNERIEPRQPHGRGNGGPRSTRTFSRCSPSAGDLHARTGGAFDITSTPLSRCWGFLRPDGRLPTSEAIAAARALVGMSASSFDDASRTVRFQRSGMELNLGSIGKGYALDRMATLNASSRGWRTP